MLSRARCSSRMLDWVSHLGFRGEEGNGKESRARGKGIHQQYELGWAGPMATASVQPKRHKCLLRAQLRLDAPCKAKVTGEPKLHSGPSHSCAQPLGKSQQRGPDSKGPCSPTGYVTLPSLWPQAPSALSSST